MVVLPRLSGAYTLELDVSQRGQLTAESATLPINGIGIGVGYSFFFDPHGTRRLRLTLDADLSGDSEISSALALGVTASYAIRTYNSDFAYLGFGFRFMLRRLWVDTQSRETSTGFETGIGLELPTLGTLFWDQPYLFGDLTNTMMLTYSTVSSPGNRGNFALFGKVELRLDWARTADPPKASKKWE